MANIETFSLTPAEQTFVDKKSDAGVDFYTRIKTGVEEYGSVTKKMKDAIKKDMAEEKNRPRVAGKPVANRVLRDGKAICRESPCKEFAKVVVGEFGYCAPHGAEHAEAAGA